MGGGEVAGRRGSNSPHTRAKIYFARWPPSLPSPLRLQIHLASSLITFSGIVMLFQWETSVSTVPRGFALGAVSMEEQGIRALSAASFFQTGIKTGKRKLVTAALSRT